MALSRFSRLKCTPRLKDTNRIEHGNRVWGVHITQLNILPFRRASTLSLADGLNMAFLRKLLGIRRQHSPPTDDPRAPMARTPWFFVVLPCELHVAAAPRSTNFPRSLPLLRPASALTPPTSTRPILNVERRVVSHQHMKDAAALVNRCCEAPTNV